MSKKSLIIWLPTGETMKFEDVKNFKESCSEYGPLLEGVIAFDYRGVSTEEFRNATFFKDNIMGYAITDLERESE